MFLVRHGTPLTNTGLDYRSMPGPDLSEAGKAEARQAAAFLADKQVEHLFVSPFARATQTAEQIVASLHLPLTFTRLITEHHITESDQRVQERMHEFVRGVEDSPLSRIAVVTHGSPVKQLLLVLTRMQIDLSMHVYDPSKNPAPPAGIWHVQRQDGDVWQAALVFKPLSEETST
jgi:2,3-bisphosphoglycerate-dependent phosphoglycerate mutase